MELSFKGLVLGFEFRDGLVLVFLGELFELFHLIVFVDQFHLKFGVFGVEFVEFFVELLSLIFEGLDLFLFVLD